MSMNNVLLAPETFPRASDGASLLEYRLSMRPVTAVYRVQGICSFLHRVFADDSDNALLLDGDDREGLTFLLGLCADMLGDVPAYLKDSPSTEEPS